MNDPLATYLHDHLAGADFAIDLLQAMKERQQDQPLGQFAGQLLTEVTQDRDILQHFADGVGSGSNVLKEFTASSGRVKGLAEKPFLLSITARVDAITYSSSTTKMRGTGSEDTICPLSSTFSVNGKSASKRKALCWRFDITGPQNTGGGVCEGTMFLALIRRLFNIAHRRATESS